MRQDRTLRQSNAKNTGSYTTMTQDSNQQEL